jgi:hypothetical protein
MKTLFFKPKNKSLAKIITITSVKGFKDSIRKLRKKGITTEEKRALVLAQNRARAHLKKKTLSPSVRKRFKAIAKLKLPAVTLHQKNKKR